MKSIHVAAAVIRSGRRVYATQRGSGPQKDGWEFPGGKLEPGESSPQALVREIREELGAEIRVGELIRTVDYDYPDFHLRMDCFWAETAEGALTLKEHEAARWLGPEELEELPWLPPDRVLLPAVREALLRAAEPEDPGTEGQLRLELRDLEWPYSYTDHDRQIVRAMVVDEAGYWYFVRVRREDEFGPATLIESSGGGVEPGESLEEAIRRELREELGAEVELLGCLGLVSDYYNLIHRHNLNHYYLCRVRAWGEKHLMPDEIRDFHLSTLRLRAWEAAAEYEARACTPLGRLIAARELPVLRRAAAMLGVSLEAPPANQA